MGGRGSGSGFRAGGNAPAAAGTETGGAQTHQYAAKVGRLVVNQAQFHRAADPRIHKWTLDVDREARRQGVDLGTRVNIRAVIEARNGQYDVHVNDGQGASTWSDRATAEAVAKRRLRAALRGLAGI